MAEELTIDELARETGMTVRNIRSHATRGLLQPPVVRARTGYYGPDHVARLKLIQELQGNGYNLAAIKHLVARTGGRSSEDVLTFARSLLSPYEPEQPEIAEADELVERFGPLDEKTIAKALKLGVVVDIGEGKYEIPSPTLLRGGDALVDLGVPIDKVLSILEHASRQTDSIAERFVGLYMDKLWDPDAAETLDELRRLASDVVMTLFHQRMTRRTEKAFDKELHRGT